MLNFHSAYGNSKKKNLEQLLDSHSWIQTGAGKAELIKTIGPKLLRETQKFVLNPQNKKVLRSNKGKKLRKMQEKLNSLMAIHTKFDQCIKNKESKDQLDQRILDAAYATTNYYGPCHDLESHHKEIDDFYKMINKPIGYPQRVHLQELLHHQAMKNSLKTLMDLRYKYEDQFLSGNSLKELNKDLKNALNQICYKEGKNNCGRKKLS